MWPDGSIADDRARIENEAGEEDDQAQSDGEDRPQETVRQLLLAVETEETRHGCEDDRPDPIGQPRPFGRLGVGWKKGGEIEMEIAQ